MSWWVWVFFFFFFSFTLGVCISLSLLISKCSFLKVEMCFYEEDFQWSVCWTVFQVSGTKKFRILLQNLVNTPHFLACSKKQIKSVKFSCNWCNVFTVDNIAKQVGSVLLHQLYHPSNLQTKGMMNYVVRRNVCQGTLGLVLELVLFNIFINDLGEGVNRPLIELADITQK